MLLLGLFILVGPVRSNLEAVEEFEEGSKMLINEHHNKVINYLFNVLDLNHATSNLMFIT